MKYTYGMKLRGFSIGCQPNKGFVERKDDTSGKYHDLIIYDRELTQEELNRYSLELIESDKEMKKYNFNLEEYDRIGTFYEVYETIKNMSLNGVEVCKDENDSKIYIKVDYDNQEVVLVLNEVGNFRVNPTLELKYDYNKSGKIIKEVEVFQAIEDKLNESSKETQKEKDMKKTKATVIPMIKQLESLFSKLNDKFFEGKLETPVITIAPDTCRAYGWFTTWRAWKETDNKDSEGYYEINVTCDYLNRTPVEIASTLLHEMVHLYCQMNGIKDTSRAGNYHNKNFKIAAEEHGLICEKVQKSGFGCTEPTPKTAEYLESLNLKFDLYRPTPEPEQKVVKRSSSRKYVCPVCGSIIRATKPVRVICADCGVEYEEVVS